MSDKPTKKFYWTEGVSRKGVESALAASRFPTLYRQDTRRRLVALYGFGLFALAISPIIDWEKGRSYLEGISFFGLLFLYVILRRAVRLIADAPTELLDERLVVLRDRSYLSAYRWLSGIIGFYMGVIWSAKPLLDSALLLPVLLFFGMLVIALPSMVLAWRMPSEPPPSDD